MKFLQITRLIISLLPALIQAIRAAEEAIPGTGKGEIRLAMVRGLLESAYSVSQDVEQSFDDVWPAVNKAINVLVATLKGVKAI